MANALSSIRLLDVHFVHLDLDLTDVFTTSVELAQFTDLDSPGAK